MTLIVTKKGNSYPPIEGGTYQGICIGVIDIGTQYNDYYQKEIRRVIFIWELPELRIEVEKDGEKLNLPRVISKTSTKNPILAEIWLRGEVRHLQQRKKKDLMQNVWQGKIV